MQPPINLTQFSGGTGRYYKHFLNGVYSDGMKYIAEQCGAYWLMDLVLSHRPKLAKKLSLQNFPVRVTLESWKTEAKPDGAKCLVNYHNSNGEPLQFTLQTVPSTNFPFERFKDEKFSFLLGYDTESRKLILSLIQED